MVLFAPQPTKSALNEVFFLINKILQMFAIELLLWFAWWFCEIHPDINRIFLCVISTEAVMVSDSTESVEVISGRQMSGLFYFSLVWSVITGTERMVVGDVLEMIFVNVIMCLWGEGSDACVVLLCWQWEFRACESSGNDSRWLQRRMASSGRRRPQLRHRTQDQPDGAWWHLHGRFPHPRRAAQRQIGNCDITVFTAHSLSQEVFVWLSWWSVNRLLVFTPPNCSSNNFIPL